MTKLPFGQRLIEREIEDLGDTITIREITKTYDKYYDAQESYTEKTVTAFVNMLLAEDDEVKEGIYKQGDKRFFIKPSESVKRGDEIKHNDKWYKVDEIDDQTGANTLYNKEVVARKV